MGKKAVVEPQTSVAAGPAGEPVATPPAAPATPLRVTKKKPGLIAVRSPHGVPFWERHPDHPRGEVWVAGHDGQAGPVVEVARTTAVEAALRDGRLELAG